MKALGYKYEGKDFVFSIDDSVENSSKLMTYDNTNLIDAMFSMADNWGCDCWVTDHVINFGRCEFSDAVKIELDREAKDMSRSDSKVLMLQESTHSARRAIFRQTTVP